MNTRTPLANRYNYDEGVGDDETVTLYDQNILQRNKKTVLLVGVILTLVAFAVLLIIIAIVAKVVSSNRNKKHPVVANVLVINAKVWTGNKDYPWAEAFSVVDNKIAEVGTSKHIQSRYKISNDTLVLDGKNTLLVTPGFTDSHIHILTGGLHMRSIKLRDAMSQEEFIDMVREYMTTVSAGKWVKGGDWNHENWGGSPLPNKGWIDSLTQNNPVYLNRMDGHMALCNSVALQKANITKDTPNPEGGEIDRDENGEPTGILRDNAMNLIDDILPIDPEEQDLAMKAAMDYVVSKGVTHVVNVGNFNELDVFKRAHANKSMKLRIHHATPLTEWQKMDQLIKTEGRGDNWLSLGALKGFVDGSLGSHTALQFENYADLNTTGLQITDTDVLYECAKGADKAGLQIAVHAIGDRANDVILSIYERILQENGNKDRRFRIEHAQQVRPQDIPRFKNVIASMQPTHLVSDIPYAERLLGLERMKDLYQFHSMKKHAIRLVFGSDWYVEDPDVISALYTAVTRITENYPNGFANTERISVEEALKSYTVDAAYAVFKEKTIGQIKEGYLADFAVLDRDITKIQGPEFSDLKSTQILYTFVDGKKVYNKPNI